MMLLVGCTESTDKKTLSKNGLFLASKTTLETTQPVSLTDTENIIRFEFPKSAKNIQFASYSEWIARTTYVRFEASIEDCIATAEKIITEHKSKDPNFPVPVLTDTLDPEWKRLENPHIDATWFNPTEIRQGKKSEKFRSTIWVDTARGVFYYYDSD